MKTMKTEPITDEKLILSYKQGNEDAFAKLVNMYSPCIHFYCKTYYAKGLLEMDLYQEGCIGLYVALTKFESSKGTFRAFAEIHIKNKIINAVKAATRKKHQILNECASYNIIKEEMGFPSGELLVIDQLASDIATPEEVYFQKVDTSEKQNKLNRLLKTMTRMERLVFIEISHGKTYREASASIGVSPKAVDNAIRRIKKKAVKKSS